MPHPVDRLDRAPAAGGFAASSRSISRSGPRCRRALRQSAARSDRGADLRPRMAVRLRQAAAAAWWLVEIAHRARAPTPPITRWRKRPWSSPLPSVFATARPLVGARSARWLAVLIVDGFHYFQVHRGEIQSRRRPVAVLGGGGLRLPLGAQARPCRTWLLLGVALGGAPWANCRRRAGGASRRCMLAECQARRSFGYAGAIAGAGHGRCLGRGAACRAGCFRRDSCRSLMPRSSAPKRSAASSIIFAIRRHFAAARSSLPCRFFHRRRSVFGRSQHHIPSRGVPFATSIAALWSLLASARDRP